MCGRYVLKSPFDEIADAFEVGEIAYTNKENYNISPGTWIASIIQNENNRTLLPLHWGLIPSWAKDQSFAAKMINARSETLTEKASFKAAYRRRRCIIPANGYYEWKKKGKDKTPYYISLKSKEIMPMAGLWENWTSPDGSLIQSCSIITTEANKELYDIHPRMPVILDKDNINVWLHHKDEDTDHLNPLFQPYPYKNLDCYTVSSKVNSVKNNSPQCIEREEPMELF